MQRSFVLVLVLVLAAVLGAVWWFTHGDPAPPPVDRPPAETPLSPDPVTTASAGPQESTGRPSERIAVAMQPAGWRDDPEILASLTGWKGRVIDHTKAPVAGCGVRLYRGAFDSVLPDGMDLFAEESTYAPHYVAGETKTGDDGRFEFNGVWPRAFFVLFAGIGTDAPTHQLLARSPSPGEVVDLGDIVLPNAGVVVGTVVDEEGEPLAGALVRAADLPGSLAGFFPVERFDPEGALLIREQNSPWRVVEMPKWVKSAFEDLPIPTARSGPDGAFRLVGVVPGNNMLATTQRAFLSDVKPGLQIRAGQTKDVGRIKLRRGEELTGRVVDAKGKPVAGAEVFAGSTIAIAPVDLAQRLAPTDAEGRFAGTGFVPGRVTVAARRSKGHAWALAQPQAIAGDVVVVLPSTFAVDVRVTLTDGQPVKEPRLRVLPGRPGQGATEMHLLGFSAPIDLRDRLRPVGDGAFRIENLGTGSYVLLADAPGLAMSFVGFDILDADASVALQMTQPQLFSVRVIADQERPVRNARVFGSPRGGQRLQDMPVVCGFTGDDGRLRIDRLRGDSLRVTAEHPKWGSVHGEVKVGEEVVLRMQTPGSLRGVVTENGQVPPPGKFSLGMIRRSGNETRGATETIPNALTPGVDGTFFVPALQPGSYELVAIKSLEALRSPGGVLGMVQEMSLWREREEVAVDIASGQESTVHIEAGEKPIDGPTATVAGAVMVDGRPGASCVVTAWGSSRRFAARVDERGRFDLGTVPAGRLSLSVESSVESAFGMGGGSRMLWQSSIELKQGEARELAVDIVTSAMSGVCLLPDGRPASGITVDAQGRLKSANPEAGRCWLNASTDAEGRFRFVQVPEGSWDLTAQDLRDRDNPVRGRLVDVAVTGASSDDSLRIQLEPVAVVKGRVDIAAFGKKARWIWVGFARIKADTPPGERGEHVTGTSANVESGNFQEDHIDAGTYRIRFQVGFGDSRQEYLGPDIEVPKSGVRDVLLRPGAAVK